MVEPRRGRVVTVRGMLWLTLLFLWTVGSAYPSSLVPQTALPGTCIPKFVVQLPVFGPASSIPRVDTVSHDKITVTMKESDQAVLPVGMDSLLGEGCPSPAITFKKTRAWAYEIADTRTGEVLGPAHWPAVTIEAGRGHPTQITYINQLPHFEQTFGRHESGLVQGLIAVDSTVPGVNPYECAMHINCEKNLNEYCCQQYVGTEPTAVHLHGAETAACYDGTADQWFTSTAYIGPQYCTDDHPGPGKDIYTYANSQEPGTLWFHDHYVGATRNNVYSGLAGFYFLRDPSTEPKKLPSGPYEIELIIQDRVFDTNSQLALSNIKATDPFNSLLPSAPQYHPFWIIQVRGDVATVNGVAWPYLKVEPRRYRFRILDGANERRFDLHFGGAPVWQFGADDNYLDTAAKVNDAACPGKPDSTERCSDVSLLPGERADVIVDFTHLTGKTITATNSGPNFYHPLPEVMQFRVELPLKGRDESCDPAKPDPVNGICARRIPMVRLTDGKGHLAQGVKIDKVREFALVELNTHAGKQSEIGEFVNNTKRDGLLSPSIQRHFPTDGVSELPQVGSTELWEFINFATPDVVWHAMHVHLAQFQILNRQAFDYKDYHATWNAAFPASCPHINGFCPGYGPPLDYLIPNADRALGGNPAVGPFLHDSKGKPTPIIPPDPGESGWKDTVKAFPHQVLRIVVRWTPSYVPLIRNKSYAGRNFYNFDPTKGYYAWHCHLAGHEDNEMMRPYKVSK